MLSLQSISRRRTSIQFPMHLGFSTTKKYTFVQVKTKSLQNFGGRTFSHDRKTACTLVTGWVRPILRQCPFEQTFPESPTPSSTFALTLHKIYVLFNLPTLYFTTIQQQVPYIVNFLNSLDIALLRHFETFKV